MIKEIRRIVLAILLIGITMIVTFMSVGFINGWKSPNVYFDMFGLTGFGLFVLGLLLYLIVFEPNDCRRTKSK